MNQMKKIFLYAMILLHIKSTNVFTAAPTPTSYNLSEIQKRISKANSSISVYTTSASTYNTSANTYNTSANTYNTWKQPTQASTAISEASTAISEASTAISEASKAIGELVKLIQGLYQIINLETPELGAALAKLDSVFAAGTPYVTAQDLNISPNPGPTPTPTPTTIPQSVYTSLDTPLGTVEATAYPLTDITINIFETTSKMMSISNWTTQLSFLTEDQLNDGIYFAMNVDTSANVIYCYVFESDKQTQIGKTFSTPLTCALNGLSVTYNSQTETISSNLPPNNFAILITSDYTKTIPSSVVTSMTSPATITGNFNAPLLQAMAQAQPGTNNPILDMGPFTASSPLNTISSDNWTNGIYITMFINTASSSITYDFWASDKATHLGTMSQSLPSITGLTSSTFSYEDSYDSNTRTATITPTKALFLKANAAINEESSYYGKSMASDNTSVTTISKADLESLKVIFTIGSDAYNYYNIYSANGISGQLLQNTEIDISAGIYLIPAFAYPTDCHKSPCILFFDSNKNFLGIQGITGASCPTTGLTGLFLQSSNSTESDPIALDGASYLLKITS